MTLQINLSDLKVGDKLADSHNHGYGYFANRVVTKIETTKGGRYYVWESATFVGADGKSEDTHHRLFNGPKAATYKMVVVK